jgi:hypothetical protein
VIRFASLGIVSLESSPLISYKSADTLHLGIAGIKETLDSHLTLTPTTTGVLTLALNLPYEYLPFMIFIDNLFISYELFSILRKYGIGACGTTRANRLGEYFKDEIIKKNNSKIL